MKTLLRAVGAVLALALMTASHAQPYPNKPVRFLVGFAAGGPTDVAMRTFAAKMSEIWGRTSWSRTTAVQAELLPRNSRPRRQLTATLS